MKQLIKSSMPQLKIYPESPMRTNEIVNLSKVKTISTGRGKKGHNKLYDITFCFSCSDENDCEVWLYQNEADRDKDMAAISENYVIDLGEQ